MWLLILWPSIIYIPRHDWLLICLPSESSFVEWMELEFSPFSKHQGAGRAELQTWRQYFSHQKEARAWHGFKITLAVFYRFCLFLLMTAQPCTDVTVVTFKTGNKKHYRYAFSHISSIAWGIVYITVLTHNGEKREHYFCWCILNVLYMF